MKGRLAAVIVVVAAVGAGVLLAARGTDLPYDLDSAAPDGFKGLRVVLEGLGVEVRRGSVDGLETSDGSTFDTVFVPDARGIPDSGRERLERFARAGGRVVLGTPREDSPVDPFGSFQIVGVPPGDCTIPELGDARTIDPRSLTPIPVPAGAQRCYAVGRAAHVISEAEGEGRIIRISSAELFVNDAMRPRDQEVDEPKGPMPDNVVVAVGLLAPAGGGTRVLVINAVPGSVPSGERTVVGLIRPGVKVGLWQLGVAVVVYAWFRGRRFGRVVDEPQPVPIEGSELTVAVGQLMRRRADPERAAEQLRSAALVEITRRLGLVACSDVRATAQLVAARIGADPHAVLGVLADDPVADDAALVELANRLHTIRQEVLHD